MTSVLDRDDRPLITIRRATEQERHDRFPPVPGGNGKRQRVPKYVCVGEHDRIWTVFGLPQGGDTRAEAVFWAERAADKNDLRYEPPVGWENIEGKLPSAATKLSDRERAALVVLSEQDGPVWPGLVGRRAGDDRPSWIVGHSWRNTLFALERKGLASLTYRRGTAPSASADFSITAAGREAIA